MNAIFDYICDEIEEIEQKIQRDGKLSMTEIEYLDKLEHIKKDMLTSEAMMDSGYSNDGSYDGYNGNGGSMTGGSYMRGNSGRRGGRMYGGRRYSRDEAKDEVMRHLEKAMNGATGEQRKIIQEAVDELKNM